MLQICCGGGFVGTVCVFLMVFGVLVLKNKQMMGSYVCGESLDWCENGLRQNSERFLKRVMGRGFLSEIYYFAKKGTFARFLLSTDTPPDKKNEGYYQMVSFPALARGKREILQSTFGYTKGIIHW